MKQTDDVFKIRLKSILYSAFLVVGIIGIFLGESLFSYKKNKEASLIKAKEVITQKISDLEKIVDSDLERLKALDLLVPVKNNLELFYENSEFNFLLKYRPITYSLYIFLLFGQDSQIYSKYGALKEAFIPQSIIEESNKDIRDFKVFYYKNKIYFSKGDIYRQNQSYIILLAQNISEFVKYLELERVIMVLKDSTKSFKTSKEGLWGYVKLQYTLTWWEYFLQERLSLLLWCVFSVGIGLLTFIGNILRIITFIEKKYEKHIKSISKNLLLLKSTLEENKKLKEYIYASKDSKEGMYKIIQNIFPSYYEILDSLQDVQKALILHISPEKMEEILNKYERSIKSIEDQNEEIKISVRRILKDIELSLKNKLLENSIALSISGKDFDLFGPSSSLYYAFYFLLSKIISRIPPNGFIKIELEEGSDFSKVIIKDNGFSFSENHMDTLKETKPIKDEIFLTEPKDRELLKVAQMLGWSMSWRIKKGSLNITKVVINSASKNVPKHDKSSNIVNLFKKR